MTGASYPRRTHALRWRGQRLLVYRVTTEAVRSSWRKDALDAPKIDRAAREALQQLDELVALSRVKVA